MKFTRKKPSACHKCRKNIFKEKILRKNKETPLKFSQRSENIHCKIIHPKITFFNNIFGHLALFLDWSHGTRYRINTWTCSFTFHFVLGAVHKVCHTIFDDFWPPLPPVTDCHKSWTSPLKVCHTFEQKVKQISRRMETALNNYNRYYYILSNNNGCLSVFNEPWN